MIIQKLERLIHGLAGLHFPQLDLKIFADIPGSYARWIQLLNGHQYPFNVLCFHPTILFE